jgi:hypothetical protein
MRGCATCAELELLLEKTADDHWNLVLHGSGRGTGTVQAPPGDSALTSSFVDAINTRHRDIVK